PRPQRRGLGCPAPAGRAPGCRACGLRGMLRPRSLLAECAPRLPRCAMAERVVVLGGGSTGEAFCAMLRRLDPDVSITLVERGLVGGECTYYACMPSKTLLRSPELVAAAKIAPGARLGPLDVAAVFEWRDKVVDGWNDAGQEQWLAERRI